MSDLRGTVKSENISGTPGTNITDLNDIGSLDEDMSWKVLKKDIPKEFT